MIRVNDMVEITIAIAEQDSVLKPGQVGRVMHIYDDPWLIQSEYGPSIQILVEFDDGTNEEFYLQGDEYRRIARNRRYFNASPEGK